MIEVNNMPDGLGFLIFMILVYTLPALVALTRWRLLGHQQVTKIITIDIFLGWTLWGWIYAMYLAGRETLVERQQNPQRRIY